MSDKQLPEAKTLEAASPENPKWTELGWLPFELSLELPLAQFRVRDLVRLQQGGIVQTSRSAGTEIPLRANGQVIGWAELEPLGDHLAARVTELC
jgi:flagellar motor switch/type III secretory pathway protein FliN